MQQGGFHSSLSSIMDSGCMRLSDKIALTILMGIPKTWHCLISKTTSSVITANPSPLWLICCIQLRVSSSSKVDTRTRAIGMEMTTGNEEEWYNTRAVKSCIYFLYFHWTMSSPTPSLQLALNR
ncbi:predicted protein [Lichtheimia corymbifera JMRC:FSU:9682]|uniref:Uncharacterized protein n=1 Tax=Lichtheimia corymbifera JMRC:FSU:9682 TaxID=1263082 RepID=A0A068SFB4_9FUNG|nr:predicted protein [Lichtheimia corymbifera JMRC:FSU:9682]